MIVVIKMIESTLEFDTSNISAIGFYKNTCVIHFTNKNIRVKLYDLTDFYWKFKGKRV